MPLTPPVLKGFSPAPGERVAARQAEAIKELLTWAQQQQTRQDQQQQARAQARQERARRSR
jgi:hypothetical protein